LDWKKALGICVPTTQMPSLVQNQSCRSICNQQFELKAVMNRKLKIPKMYNFRKEKEDNYKKYLSVPEWFLKLGWTHL
jgi:hypothetical protein